MARRRQHHEEHENHERWLVSYADFITLLFAFFVVMYSISSVNEGKYRVLSETLSSVFKVEPRSNDPIQIGERPRSMTAMPVGPLAPKQMDANNAGEIGGKGNGEQQAAAATEGEGKGKDADPSEGSSVLDERFKEDGTAMRIADELQISLQEYIDNDLLRITREGERIEIEMKEKMLFPSGEARLSRDALRALREMAKTLTRIPSKLQVEGHTDNVPIATSAFPSNWELSAARAASVVHFMARSGVDPLRMSAIGMGEHRPIADNASDKGRAANRRVTVVVLADPDDNAPASGDDVPWAEGPAVNPQ